MSSLSWPWQYSFPPFFTLQSHDETREKQLDQWVTLVLQYCQINKTTQLNLNEIRNTDLFQNQKIERKASIQLVTEVFNGMSFVFN